MSLLEKLKDVISRNFHSKEIILDPNDSNGARISFKEDSNVFGTFELNRMINYWGLDWRDVIQEFRIFSEIEEDYGTSYIEREVVIWLKDLPDFKECEHEFIYREGWSNNICKKCGYFKECE
jgi:hypothetical protein